jgi:DNA-binding PadR family transcriptional regulator
MSQPMGKVDVLIDNHSDISMDKEESEAKKQMKEEIRQENHMPLLRRNWLRHNAMVPKGFLRYHVLEALNEQPMSGSELTDHIQKHTGGKWKPSPGSIYPLLSWLHCNAYIKEIPADSELKRYELTQSGRDFLDEQTKIREKFSESAMFMASPFFDRIFSRIPAKKTNEIRVAMKRQLASSIKLAKVLQENYSEQTMAEAIKVFNETNKKIEDIIKKIDSKKIEET